MKLSVAMVARPDLISNPGGDTTQVRETAAQLRMLDVGVRIVLADSTSLREQWTVVRDADIVHFFNILLAFQYEGILDAARAAGKPVVLSPVYWDTEEFERRRGSIAPWKKVVAGGLSRLPVPGVLDAWLAQHLKSVTYNQRYRRFLSSIIGKADLLLPNSESEYLILRNRFHTDVPWKPVVNGCRHSTTPVTPFTADTPYFLCVGRIERRKNQCALIRAMEGMDVALRLIGSVNFAEAAYWDECRREADRRRVELTHVPACAWEDLLPYYHGAVAHVQPSWFETPGLSSLEAAAAGCRIICTSVGSAMEYFGSHALYCAPDDPVSIREALDEALTAGPPPAETQTFVRQHFSWQNAALQTWNAYLSLQRQSSPLALHA